MGHDRYWAPASKRDPCRKDTSKERVVAGFEEVRLLESMYAPLQVRLELRQMFDRWLTRPDYHRRSIEQDVVVDELALLNLTQHYRLE